MYIHIHHPLPFLRFLYPAYFFFRAPNLLFGIGHRSSHSSRPHEIHLPITSPLLLSTSSTQTQLQDAHASRAQCLHPQRDNRALLARWNDERKHASRQSVRELLRRRLPAGVRLRLHTVGIGLAMVSRERSRRGRLARSDNFPVGTGGDLVNGDGLVYGEFHGGCFQSVRREQRK
jgi:hypothetical protein